jgi:hypothetical protein
MTDSPRVLALLGSGETAPAMRMVQAGLLERVPAGQPRLLLETTYGFQPNEPEMTAKLLEWFAVNVGQPVEPAGLPRLDGPDALARERGLARVAAAGYLIAGPGSPSFALRQWQGSPVPGRMAQMLHEGGVIVLASAAALVAGAFTLPVYEIYKAGEDLRWLPGLNLLGHFGIDAAVVPHFDNAEGGGHDTRFCYMGEQRMALLEQMLPDGAWTLGIDEHTALVLDLEAETAAIIGRGGVTVRTRDGSRRIERESLVAFSALRPEGMGAPASVVPVDADPGPMEEPRVFHDAMAAGEIERAARAMLSLERRLAEAPDEAGRAALRSMIAALADAAGAPPAADPREVAEPFVSALLQVRAAVRAEKRWDLSDLIRDQLALAGVVVRDTPDGPVWETLPEVATV